MSSAFREDRSHFEHDSDTASVHGARGAGDEGATSAGAMHSEAASSDDHVQEKAAATPVLTKRQKVKRHCGKFWLWYLIGSIIFLAIFLPILFLVIIPAIVQRIVKSQALPVNGGAFIVVSPTELNVSLSTELDTPLPAVIDPTTLFLYNKDTPDYSPFLNITLPKQHVDGKTEVNVDGQIVQITNETELIKWFNNVWDLPQTELSVKGKSKVHLGALKSTANIKKTVEVSSLNQLSGFGIEELRLMLPPDENGNNIKGTLNLPNWGALTLGLGDISLNLMSGGVRIGLITVHDVSIPPGNNTRDFDGQLFLGTFVKNIGAILTSQADALSDGNIQIDATGNQTVVNGQRIPFVEAILNNKRVTSYVPVVQLLSDLISSFTGSGTSISLTNLVSDVFGNSTFIEEVMSNWNTTESTTSNSNSTTSAKLRRSPIPMQKLSKGLGGPAALSLLKLAARMGVAKA
ncbi:hypothetical protein F5Y15DRAFT_313206 [Xylariaceae sp. FL0016]|nr:hypothetical protein F5Y15DRAFT_313206 [Xylariaceae sp. FL0016]